MQRYFTIEEKRIFLDDSEGPLVAQRGDEIIFIKIVSLVNCKINKFPAVHTRVAAYSDLIRKK